MPLFRPPPTIGLSPQTTKKGFFSDTRNRAMVKNVINSSYFSNGIMLVILMNAVTIAWDADLSLHPSESNKKERDILDGLDYLFFCIYLVEFLLKLYVYQTLFWKNASYVFELLILIIMLIQLIIVGGGLQRDNGSQVIVDILSIFKAVRIFRAVIVFGGVQVLLTALWNTVLKSAGSVVLLLIMLWVFFAVVGYYSFGYDDNEGPIYDEWGSLSYSVVSLLTYLFAEGWVDIQKSLTERFPGSEYYAIIFITFSHFIFINLCIGIIIMNIHDATERYNEAQRKEREMQLQLKKEYLYKRQHDDVHKMMEKQKHTNYENFQEMTKSFFETLGKDDYVLMSDISSNLMWLETFIDSLQQMDMFTYRAQQSHRNLSVVLAEMAERHYKAQYGLSMPFDFTKKTTFEQYNSRVASPVESESGLFNFKDNLNQDNLYDDDYDDDGNNGENKSKDTDEYDNQTFQLEDFKRRFSEFNPDGNNMNFGGGSQYPSGSSKLVSSSRRSTLRTFPMPTIVLPNDMEEEEGEYDNSDPEDTNFSFNVNREVSSPPT